MSPGLIPGGGSYYILHISHQASSGVKMLLSKLSGKRLHLMGWGGRLSFPLLGAGLIETSSHTAKSKTARLSR